MSYQEIKGRYALKYLTDEALSSAPRDCAFVEVGCALGKGIAYMGEALIKAGRDDIALYAVDPWGGYGRNGEQQEDGPPSKHGDWQLFLESMGQHAPDVLMRTHIIRAPSARAALTMHRHSVWLCILDAGHTYQDVTTDIAAWMPTIMPGGWIGGDDHVVDFPGVEQACRYFWQDDYEHAAREDGWETWRRRVE